MKKQSKILEGFQKPSEDNSLKNKTLNMMTLKQMRKKKKEELIEKRENLVKLTSKRNWYEE